MKVCNNKIPTLHNHFVPLAGYLENLQLTSVLQNYNELWTLHIFSSGITGKGVLCNWNCKSNSAGSQSSFTESKQNIIAVKGTSAEFQRKIQRVLDRIIEEAKRLGIEDPILPRTRQISRRLDEGRQGTQFEFQTPELYYKRLYFELIDNALRGLENRFASDTWNFLAAAEKSLVTNPVDVNLISSFYGTDVEGDKTEITCYNVPRLISTETVICFFFWRCG